MREDKEFKEFRNLMARPSEFEDGFGWRTVLMALFVAVKMVAKSLLKAILPHQDATSHDVSPEFSQLLV